MFNFGIYDFIIFDCDGVILNSNKLKSNAFKRSLPNEPKDFVKEFIEYHKRNGGVSRYKKFRHYFEKIKKSNQYEKELSFALKRFANIVTKEMIECNYINGFEDFLKKFIKSHIQLYVVSGSDEKELKNIFMHRGILNYFIDIFGSPANKLDNTQKVIDAIGKKRKGIFFGDSKSDFYAAKEFGIEFVFVNGASEWENGKRWNQSKGNLVIEDFLGF